MITHERGNDEDGKECMLTHYTDNDRVIVREFAPSETSRFEGIFCKNCLKSWNDHYILYRWKYTKINKCGGTFVGLGCTKEGEIMFCNLDE